MNKFEVIVNKFKIFILYKYITILLYYYLEIIEKIKLIIIIEIY